MATVRKKTPDKESGSSRRPGSKFGHISERSNEAGADYIEGMRRQSGTEGTHTISQAEVDMTLQGYLDRSGELEPSFDPRESQEARFSDAIRALNPFTPGFRWDEKGDGQEPSESPEAQPARDKRQGKDK